MRIILIAALVAACGGKKPETVSKIDGTATVDGKPAKITGCSIESLPDPPRAGVVVTLDTGLKYRSDPYAGARFSTGGDWDKGECEKMASNSSGGADWEKGDMHVICTYKGQKLTIDATFDCGAVDRPSNRVD